MAKQKITRSRAKWEHVGNVGVDSGQIIIGDPCSIGEKSAEFQVTISTGWGDGIYPVSGLRDKDGNLIALYIDLNPFDESCMSAAAVHKVRNGSTMVDVGSEFARGGGVTRIS